MLEAAQDNLIRTINDGPAVLDPQLFNGPLDRVLLGLKAHANTISHARLVALEESFPLTLAHLGEAEFNRLSRGFTETEAARASDSNVIGSEFPVYLIAQHADQSAIELAQVEWAWLEAYHAADADALELSAIAGLGEKALLEFAAQWHPATRLLQLTAPLSSQLPDLAGASAILIIRPEAEVRLLALDAATAAIAIACKKSTQLGNLLALAAEQPGIADPAGPVLTLIGAGALVASGVDGGTTDVTSPDPTL
jgi:hypothetical protein